MANWPYYLQTTGTLHCLSCRSSELHSFVIFAGISLLVRNIEAFDENFIFWNKTERACVRSCSCYLLSSRLYYTRRSNIVGQQLGTIESCVNFNLFRDPWLKLFELCACIFIIGRMDGTFVPTFCSSTNQFVTVSKGWPARHRDMALHCGY